MYINKQNKEKPKYKGIEHIQKKTKWKVKVKKISLVSRVEKQKE